jgi:hypothetical protein
MSVERAMDLNKYSRYVRTKIPGTNIEIEFDTIERTFDYHTPGEYWEKIDADKYEYTNK